MAVTALSKVYVGDIGTLILIDCGTDISAATTTDIKLKKPNGDEVIWNGEPHSTEKNFMKYIVQEGDLDIAGLWRGNAWVVTNDWQGRGESFSFNVYNPYDEEESI